MPPIAATYRRFLLDMHVPDWDPRFLGEFDPERFLDLVEKAGVATVTVPSNGHHGLAFYPSVAGPVHHAPGADTFLPRLLEGAGRRGLNRVVYYCLLYVDRYWQDHPEARITFGDGTQELNRVATPGNPPRFGVVCPNDRAYREFAAAQLTELAGYDFEGMNLDMMFWSAVCYCASCQARSQAELGASIPTVVDWRDPAWVRFADARRRWLEELVEEITSLVLRLKPGIDVTHQGQMYTHEWRYGGGVGLSRWTAWLSADLYRPTRELSFDFKLFHGLSQRHPFEQISSWNSPSIHEHVLLRNREDLDRLAALATMNDAALVVIDQPDPDGTVTESMYPVLAPVFDRVAALEPLLGGEPVHDVLVYVSYESGYDLDREPHAVASAQPGPDPETWHGGPNAHLPAARQAAVALMGAHVPFGVVTRKHLDRLAPGVVLVLPNVTRLDDDEVTAIDDFVARGGAVYASGATSLLGPAGAVSETFRLRSLGVDHVRRVDMPTTYVAPTAAGAEHFPHASHRRPLTLISPQEHVTAAPDTVVLATVTHPWTDPRGPRYASTITNPPGPALEWPSVVWHPYGAGAAVYSAGVLEAGTHPDHRAAFVSLVLRLLRREPTLELDAPDTVEATMFDHGEFATVHLVDIGDARPSPAVRGLVLTVRGHAVRAVWVVPGDAPVEFGADGDTTHLTVPEFTVATVLRIDWADA